MGLVIVSSPEPNAGKTAFVVALGQRLRRLGKRVGYRRIAGEGDLADAEFVAKALRIGEPTEQLVVVSAAEIGPADGADVVLVEAADGRPEAARWPDAAAVIVARFGTEGLAERIVEHARAVGSPGALVALNVVPEKGLRQARQKVIPRLAEAGLTVVGVVPQDRALLGMSVGELATALGADVLCAADQLALPVEAVMIAAMSDEGAEEYFGRVDRKAVVCGGDRPDIQLPALATDTSCIVLTDGLDPDPTVYKTADEQGVPLLKVRPGTVPTLDDISTALENVRFRASFKVPAATSVFGASLDEARLLAALGLAAPERT